MKNTKKNQKTGYIFEAWYQNADEQIRGWGWECEGSPKLVQSTIMNTYLIHYLLSPKWHIDKIRNKNKEEIINKITLLGNG